MASKYWIKLYHEILHDPKMGRLSDRLWRRFVELCLIAGECEGDGILPTVSDMAWTLRLEESELQADLDELQALGFVRPIEESPSYEVTNFAKRQAPMPGAERVSRYRDRQRQEQYYGNDECNESLQADVTPDVTIRQVEPEVEAEAEKDLEAEVEKKPAPAAFTEEDQDLLDLIATVPRMDMGAVRPNVDKMRQKATWNMTDVSGWVAEGKRAPPEIGAALVIARLLEGIPPPADPDSNPRRFVEGLYAEFIQH